MPKSIFVLIFLIVVSCTQKKGDDEKKLTRKYAWVRQENSKYFFDYPSDWVLTRNAGPLAESIHLESHASASVDFDFRTLPDTIPGSKYIDHMISSINNSRLKLTKNALIKKSGKIYTDIVYEQTDYVGVWRHEHILFTDGQKTYSLQFTTNEKLTPEEMKENGVRILTSFEVK